MFKSSAQILVVIDLAKAYNYEQAQVIAGTLQTHINTELEDRILSNNAEIRTLIKSMEFIGANNEDNNKLEDRLQELIKQPVLSTHYAEPGYVESGYVV